MTNRTTAVHRPGAGVLFEKQDTPARSDRTTNRTPVEREQDNEQDRHEQDTRHAHEQDTDAPIRAPLRRLTHCLICGADLVRWASIHACPNVLAGRHDWRRESWPGSPARSATDRDPETVA